MTVRSIRPEELDACCAIGGGPGLAETVRKLWQEGSCSPDLCFTAERDGRPVGWTFFFRTPFTTNFYLTRLHIEASADYSETGRALLKLAADKASAAGAATIGYAVYDIYDPAPARTQQLLEACGFKQTQVKRRYVWKDPGTAVEVPTRLEFRPLSVVGEEAYIEALGRITEATLDREDQADIARLGLAAAGPSYMALLRDLEFLPDEWQLACLPDGKLCGLVVPQAIEFGSEGAINYIGVVPELRGSGYGFDLLLKGTAQLQRRGLRTVVAETDVENRPLHAHLERAGYVHKGTLANYRLDLPQP
jgi:ribosomal protein S18 acetylase RimI-like enzyme